MMLQRPCRGHSSSTQVLKSSPILGAASDGEGDRSWPTAASASYFLKKALKQHEEPTIERGQHSWSTGSFCQENPLKKKEDEKFFFVVVLFFRCRAISVETFPFDKIADGASLRMVQIRHGGKGNWQKVKNRSLLATMGETTHIKQVQSHIFQHSRLNVITRYRRPNGPHASRRFRKRVCGR